MQLEAIFHLLGLGAFISLLLFIGWTLTQLTSLVSTLDFYQLAASCVVFFLGLISWTWLTDPNTPMGAENAGMTGDAEEGAYGDCSEDTLGPWEDPPAPESLPIDFTVESLMPYNGMDPVEGPDGETPLRKRIFICAKGTVFDMTSRPDFYGPEGGYKMMAGRDASVALAKMSLDPADTFEPVDWSTLDASEMDVLNDWYTKYEEKYPVMGQLVKKDAATDAATDAPKDATTDAAVVPAEGASGAAGATDIVIPAIPDVPTAPVAPVTPAAAAPEEAADDRGVAEAGSLLERVAMLREVATEEAAGEGVGGIGATA